MTIAGTREEIAGDDPEVVDRHGLAGIYRGARICGDIMHAVLIGHERVPWAGLDSRAACNLMVRIDHVRRRIVGTARGERPEVDHGTVVPEECVSYAVSASRRADDLAVAADPE